MRHIGRALFVGGLAAAVLATLSATAGGPRFDGADGGKVSAQGGPDAMTGGPLATGSWQSIANGDRINRLLREGRTVWSATDGGGLVRWDLDSGQYHQYLAPQTGLPSNVVYDIEPVGDASYWLGTGAGLVHFFPSVDRFDTIVPVPGAPEGMPGRVVTSVLRRPDGKLWVGFGQEWDPKLRHVRRDKDGAFTSAGLALYDPEANAWSYQVHSSISGDPASIKTVPSENVTDLAFDTNHNLWIGTKRYNVWQHYCPEGNSNCVDAWVPAGGGVAVTDLDQVATAGGAVDTGKWNTYRQETNSTGSANAQTTCYSDSISMLRADIDGRMWVATLDRGLLLFRKGLTREGCSGLPRYTEVSKGGTYKVEGLRGKHVFSIDVDDQGCLWIGHGSGRDVGQGIAILCHNNTFDDSSISDTPWISDDQWQFFTFAGLIEGDTNALIDAILVEPGADKAIIGTRDDRGGDGFGIAEFTLSTQKWVQHKTASNGLPSNHVTDVRRDPKTGDVWFSLRSRGVARRKADGSWQWWRAFGPGREVTQVKTATMATSRLVNIPVKLADKAAFDAIFSGSNRFIVIGDDPTRYRVTSFVAAANGLGPWIKIQPNLQQDVEADTPINLIDRGPPSNEATRIDFGADGTAYVGGRESVWMSANECANPPECWLDGGLGVYDGTNWTVYGQPVGTLDSSGLVDQMVNAIKVDLTGKVWVGTGDQDSTQGDGISILDPATGKFTHQYIPPTGGSGVKLGSNGIGDLDVDTANGHMWAAHFPTKKNNTQIDGSVSQVMFGGGASMWNGSDWTAWKKDKGALIKGYGLGTFSAILADRVHNLAWLGGWDAVPRQFHWTEGRGVNAALNWCSLDDCRNDGWQSRTWDNEGEVNRLALDKNGDVWVSMNRRDLGLIPPFGGVRVFDGVNWFAYNPSNTPMTSLNVTSLSAYDDGVFLGTFDAGVSVFSFTVPPTATPAPTFTPSPTASSTRAATIEFTPTTESGTRPPTATRTPTPSPTRNSQGTPPASGCRPGEFSGWCYIHLPYMYRYCRGVNCPKRTTPLPTITRGTPLPTATKPATTAPPSATPPPPSPTPTLGAGTGEAPTASPSATDTGAAPSPVPSASETSGPSPTAANTATATATRSPVPTATATQLSFPEGEWQNMNRSGQVTRATLNDVHGASNVQVVMVGATSTLLIWDGVNFTSSSVPPGRTLNGVQMLDNKNGYAVGDFVGQSSTLLQTRNGGQTWQIGTTVNLDNWAAVAVFKGASGIRGWIVGKTSGSRQYFDGTQWAKQSSSDLNNTSHKYSDVAMLSETRAIAVQNGGTGSRVYEWDGTAWSPGAQTGPLNALDVLPSGDGAAVGPIGAVWVRTPDGAWSRMDSKPSTSGRDLLGVKMLAPNRIWAVGERGGMYLWNGLSWQTVTVTGITKDLRSVWFTSDGRDGWAVGLDGTIARFVVPSPTPTPTLRP
ncbi:MAG: two-component regulator propeller domain-containing protein [Ardenticatenales bacterium]